MSQVFDGQQLEKLIQQINIGAGSMLGARADFRPELFDAAIYQKGYRILWEQGMFCSCYTKGSGQPDYNCSTCKGKGYLYFGGKEIRAVVTSINGHKDQHRAGLDEVGSAYLTPRSKDNIGFRDKFTFLDFTTRFSEVLIRDEDRLGTRIDKLRYPAQDIIMVRSLEREFKRGLEFDLSKDGKYIEWREDYLYEGDQFSILYTTNPVYIAIGPIHELRGTYSMAKAGGLEAFHQLPKQYQIKREDFMDNE
jgi:hypothetical protein